MPQFSFILHPPILRAFRVDSVISEERRIIILRTLDLCVVFIGIFVLLDYAFLNFASESVLATIAEYAALVPILKLCGAFIILLVLLCAGALVEFYYRVLCTEGALFICDGTEYHASVETFRLLSRTDIFKKQKFSTSDFLTAMNETLFGRALAFRLDISMEDLFSPTGESAIDPKNLFETMLSSRAKTDTQVFKAADLLDAARRLDTTFSDLLFQLKIKPEVLRGAADWVEDELISIQKEKIWWSREHLAHIQGIGKDFGYGYTYTLDQYSRELFFQTTLLSREARAEEIKAVEDVLSRSYEANVLMVGEEGVGKHAILEGLAERIREGRITPVLEHKRVVVLDGSSIVAAAKTKGVFEGLMTKILGDALMAGNIILVIENLPGFIESASKLGTSLMEILEPALGGSAIQVIAFSDHASYHRDLEPDGKVTKFFEKIDIPEPMPERSLRMIEDVLAVLEPASGKHFTFQALIRAVDLADRFIAEGAMPEKAIDLLNEAASVAGPDVMLIGPEDIEAVVKKQTNIPTGEAEEKEKETLLHMEDLLRRRIVDQEHAVRAIADALRRARSGLKSASRPIGSFLFLGPTGVGKTETAKALAEVYFGDKNAFIRFDMSEYQGEDGMKKLIGGYDIKEPGILSKRVREKPFSLLLFDEFEKASHEVHNLFLQILDEGFFSDAMGKRVSMRETMIIATSNAGTNLIWELLKEGKEFADIESRVINSIREERIFSIELLNRFDSIMVYHPLDRNQLQSVALLLLDELSRKLEVQEIHFKPTNELASRVAEIGYDPAFGARPMRRAIQNRVEQIIAKKILAGQLKRGDTFRFSTEEIAAL